MTENYIAIDLVSDKIYVAVFKQLTGICDEIDDVMLYMLMTQPDTLLFTGTWHKFPDLRQAVFDSFGTLPGGAFEIDERSCVFGAAILSGILNGDIKDYLLLDTTNYALGIAASENTTAEILPRNNVIPTRKSITFSTTEENQTVVPVYVLEGDSPLAKENHLIGRFDFELSSPKPKGVPRIEITIDIGANYDIAVSAKDLSDGKSQKISIGGSFEAHEWGNPVFPVKIEEEEEEK
jgi:molecular chaperone DnaK